MKINYKKAGVDIQSGEETVRKIKNMVKSTFNKSVLTDIGLFGAFYEIDIKKFKKPVLVSSVDGVGTKLKIAIESGIHTTIGQDLVNHCVNDIAVCGAKPLYFMDYMAFGKLNSTVASQIVSGFAVACKENKVSLIGGETAEMPGVYQKNDYDLAGTIVGIVDKKNIITGKNIKRGDILVGFPSNGLHTNGYSLARKVLLEKFKLNDPVDILQYNLKDELLKIHKSYLKIIRKIVKKISVKGISHITGGGIIGNTNRILPDNLRISIDWKSWEVPAIFNLIQETCNISDAEMRKVFNMGIGLIAIIRPKELDKVMDISQSIGEESFVIGKVI